MNNTRLLLDLPLDCEAAVAVVSLRLAGEGIHVDRAFNLESACAPFTIDSCPHTGLSPCGCKLVVLKVFEDQGPRLSLIVHSHENLTEFWEEDLPISPNPVLASRVRQLLAEEKSILLGRLD